MLKTLVALLQAGRVTQSEMFPDLPSYARGLPQVTDAPCQDCGACPDVCPTHAIKVAEVAGHKEIALDLGRCIGCGECVAACPSGTLVPNRGTRVATRTRQALVLRNVPLQAPEPPPLPTGLGRSLHVREVSSGDNAADLETAAANNAIFDASRFGIHFVASPRFADALLVTGPVGLAMQEPLRRCWEAMAEPRLVIAAGASAISGVPHDGGYASANGVSDVLPVAVFVPGWPPHPWYLLHGLLVAMGRAEPFSGAGLMPRTDPLH